MSVSFCSNRDLSMILDALLKTKSRTVLVDVINKNGSIFIMVICFEFSFSLYVIVTFLVHRNFLLSSRMLLHVTNNCLFLSSRFADVAQYNEAI